jgi:hypothetical protein
MNLVFSKGFDGAALRKALEPLGRTTFTGFDGVPMTV